MGHGRTYEIPEEELLAVAKSGRGGSALARKYKCAPSTINSQIQTMMKSPKPQNSAIPMGAGGDCEFDRRIGERRFEDDPRARPSACASKVYPHSGSHPYSLTGCAASLACV